MELAVLQGLNRRPGSIHDRKVRASNDPSVSKYEPPSITVFTLTLSRWLAAKGLLPG